VRSPSGRPLVALWNVESSEAIPNIPNVTPNITDAIVPNTQSNQPAIAQTAESSLTDQKDDHIEG